MSTMNMALIGAAIALLILLLVMRRRAAAQEASGASAQKPKKAPKPPKAHKPPKAAKPPKAEKVKTPKAKKEKVPKSARPRPERRWLGRRRRPSDDGPPPPPEPRPLSAVSETIEGVEAVPFADVPFEETVPAGDATLAEVAASEDPAPFGAPVAEEPVAVDADEWDDELHLPTEPGPDEPDWEGMRAALSGVPLPDAEGEPLAEAESHPITEEWDLQAEAPAAPAAAWAEDELITEPGWPLPGDVEDWQSDPEPFAGEEPAAPVADEGAEWLGVAHETEAQENDWLSEAPAGEWSAEEAEDEAWSTAGQPAWAEVAAVQEAVAEVEVEAEPEDSDWSEPEVQSAEWTEPAEEWDTAAPAAEEAPAAADGEWWSDESEDVWEPELPHAEGETREPAWLGEPEPVAEVVPEPVVAPEAVAAPYLDEVVSFEDAWGEPAETVQAAVPEPVAEAPAPEPEAEAAGAAPAWWEDSPSGAPAQQVPWWDGQGTARMGAAEAAASLAASAAQAARGEDPECMSGRFALGGTALRPGHEALTGVTFRAPLDRAPRGWALGEGLHASGTLVLSVDATMNCAPEGLEVLFADGMAPSVDGFTMKLTALGAGPFAVSGRFHVVP